MSSTIESKRIQDIISFLKTLNINSSEFRKLINKNDEKFVCIINEALTHSSANKNINHEKLEFFGDAVLRLSASEFIDKNFPNMEVGQRSELRAQIVSDEWLTKLGKKINLEEIVIIGKRAMRDNYSKDTILAECTEAIIGALFKYMKSLGEINLWLDQYWEQDSKLILEKSYKFNAKSRLQDGCQRKGFDLPEYKIIELSKTHGDPERFLCELYINGRMKSKSHGQSHKKAEKEAAIKAIEIIKNF